MGNNQQSLDRIFKSVEKKHVINIICTVECGSRAYGLNSDSSDYDIRYIYIQNDQDVYEEDYLDQRKILQRELHKIADVKNRSFTDKYHIVDDNIFDMTNADKTGYDYFEDPIVVDLHGWDITFAVKKLHISNPSIVEWMFSPIVYWNDPKYNFLQTARKLLINQNKSSGLIKHYIGMGKKYFREHIEDKDEVRVKKYIHCVRCCVMVEWLQINKRERFQPLIQVDFNKVLEDIEPFISNSLFNSVQRLVAKKRESDKDTYGPRYSVLDRFIERILDLDQENTYQRVSKILRVPDMKRISKLLSMIYKFILFLFVFWAIYTYL
jgi:predicted nucleotidyltransferase